MNNCKNCGSFAVNHHCHGRDGGDADLCDVCYWRKRANDARAALLSVAATLAWTCSGECRAYDAYGHQGVIASPAEADAIAKSVLSLPFNTEITAR